LTFGSTISFPRKQNLKIKSFLGTSKNAVMAQVWAAMIYYLLLAWMKFQMKIAWSILELGRRIKATLFEKTHILNLLSENFTKTNKLSEHQAQLNLF
jgi:hypothetical protein